MYCSISLSRPRAHREPLRAFTLIEVLLVLVILVVLASIAVPMYQNIRIAAMKRAAKVQVGLLSHAVELYEVSHNKYPTGLGDLIDRPSDPKLASKWEGPYLTENRNLVDPWEDPYQYTAKGVKNPNRFDVWSLGPDCENGTPDDIGNWE
jgi:general secretion pathway protein G